MNTTGLAKKYLSWRFHGIIMAEKRLMSLLASDVKPGSSDQELDALYQMISKALRDITHMQNEIITLQMIIEDAEKSVK
tara:strand:+ start:642 stop:878 length:237 start_codon:yes stop_codon:yes gene_type:complete